MAGCEQDASCCFALADDMAGGWRAEDAILTDKELLDPVRCSNLCDLLHDFRIVESAVSSNDQECACCTFGNGQENGSNEGFAVMWLLEDCDLLAEPRCAWSGIMLVVGSVKGNQTRLLLVREGLELHFLHHTGTT